MCGLFGFSHYGDNKIKDLSSITNVLAEEAAVRGTDATGIAYCEGGRVNIHKEPKSAYRINFKHSDDVVALIGHTRHSTQGSEKRNYNNHPFFGKCKDSKFALAHNGVIINDKELRKQYNLAKTKIETDSYIAVQLIESKKQLNSESIKFMAEALEGSFSFSILDNKNNLWLIKGDSPLSILHFPNLKLYIYASTDAIVWKALIETDLFGELKKGNYKQIKISCGDILCIQSDGIVTYDEFDYMDSYMGLSWRNYSFFSDDMYYNDTYLEDLKSVAKSFGVDEDMIDTLIYEGFTIDEIEEYIYCM